MKIREFTKQTFASYYTNPISLPCSENKNLQVKKEELKKKYQISLKLFIRSEEKVGFTFNI